MCIRNRLFAIAIAILPVLTVGQPQEMVLSSQVLKAKDSRTSQTYVQSGNKVRVFPRVVVKATDFANHGLKWWLSKNLPAKMMGYFVREDKGTGMQVRFQPMAFSLSRRDIFCSKANSPDFESCQAEYQLSAQNAVDIQSGNSGEHMISLRMTPPQGLGLKMLKYSAQNYFVLHNQPKLSTFAFIGLPQQ